VPLGLLYCMVDSWFAVCSKIGKYVTVCGKTCINVASLNFLGLSGRNDIEVSCMALCVCLFLPVIIYVCSICKNIDFLLFMTDPNYA